MAGTDDLRWLLLPTGRAPRGGRRGRRQGVAQQQVGDGGGGPPGSGMPPGAPQPPLLTPHQQMVQKNNMMNMNAPNAGPPTSYQSYQQQMYSGYYQQQHQQQKTHTPPMELGMGGMRSTMPNALPVHPDVQLKKLPFYDLMGELLKPSTLMPTGAARMQEQSFMFHLTPQQANEIAMNRDIGPGAKCDYVVQVQMRFCLLETSCEQDDFFPPGLVVKVNQKLCPLPNPIPTNRPGVEPKRPPKPVSISPLVRLSPTVANNVHVSWAAEYGRGYVIAISLVRKLTSTQLLSRMKTRGVRHADYTTGLIKEKLREDADSEIATTSLRVSLMCPLGKMRMSIPCRPTTCTHLQCFDANLYLQMNERKPTWTCPVCDKPGLFDKLVIDGYFQDVLNSGTLPYDGNEIQLHQDGTWSLSAVKKEEKDKTEDEPPPVKNRGGPPEVTATVEIADDMSDGEGDSSTKDSEPAKVPPKVTVDLTLSDSDDDASPSTKTPAHRWPPAGATVPTPSTAEVSTLPVPGYMSPNIITLDSPSPPISPAPRTDPSTPVAPPTLPNLSSNLPAFFDLDNDSSDFNRD